MYDEGVELAQCLEGMLLHLHLAETEHTAVNLGVG